MTVKGKIMYLFQYHQQKFYKEIIGQKRKYSYFKDSSSWSYTSDFWNSLWGHPHFYYKLASWLSSLHIVIPSATMEGFHMTVDLFNRGLRTVQNWRSLGPDCIYGYWLKHFCSVHTVLLRYFNFFLSTNGATLELSLLLWQKEVWQTIIIPLFVCHQFGSCFPVFLVTWFTST